MFEFLLKSKVHPIGLDIGHSVIKMIQLSQSEHTICVDAAEEETLDRHLETGSDQWRQQVAELIKDMYLRGGFKGQRVVSCLPGDMLKIKSLRLDTDYDEEIEEVIRTEVARRFDLDPDQDEIRHIIAGQAYQGSEIKNEVIFFGMEKQHLAAHIGLIQQAGLSSMNWGMNRTRRTSTATEIANNRIADLQNFTYDDLTAMAENNVRVNDLGTPDSDGIYRRTTTIGNEAYHCRQVTVTVTAPWRPERDDVEISLTTIILDPNSVILPEVE